MKNSWQTLWALGRFDRPVGTVLLTLPCWWALGFLQKTQVSITMLLLFAWGAFFLRAAGCAFNDWVDQDFDRQVHRTKNRPIAQNHVTGQALLLFLTITTIAGGSILWVLPQRVWGLAILAAILLIIYPFAKRWTYWPHAVLGAAFGMGIWIAGYSVTDSYEAFVPLTILYAFSVLSMIACDTIYAWQDVRDDLNAGVKSAALLLGERTKPIVAALYLMCGALLALLGWTEAFSLLSYFLIGCAHFLILIELKQLPLDSVESCRGFFLGNQYYGLLIFCALVLR